MLEVALSAGGAALIRSVGGWIQQVTHEKSEGGKQITPYEWYKLLNTVVRVGVVTFAVYYGFDLGTVESAGTAVLFDFVISALRAKKK